MEYSGWQTRTWPQLKAETQARADRGAYPVFGIKPEDAREALDNIGSLDPQAWGMAWMAIGDRYAEKGQHLEAWRLYTLGRWPTLASPSKRECFAKAQTAFAAFGQTLDPPIEPVKIPYGNATISVLLQRPMDSQKPPVVVNIGGSDLWKDSVALQARGFLRAGIAAVAVDMPGTSEAPEKCVPGAERMVSAIIDHLLERPDVDGTRVIVRGQSWGSYWSARTAYAEKDRLKGAVFQSGPVHEYFQRSWQKTAFGTKEFLFDYVPSRLHMLGQSTVEDAFAFMPSLSLLDKIEKPTPPMLLIGGGKDTQVPFSDLLLLLQNGSPKYAWINPDGQTMGRSVAIKDDDIFAEVVLPWVCMRFAA
jgi:pimeloyl-ACP methyl ester carboxylesterase